MCFSLSKKNSLLNGTSLTCPARLHLIMKVASFVSILLAIIFWVPVLFFSILLAHNAILYFTHGGDYGILPEKAFARQDPLWNVSFYTHLPAGIFCLIAPVFSFARRFFKCGLTLHKQI